MSHIDTIRRNHEIALKENKRLLSKCPFSMPKRRATLQKLIEESETKLRQINND